MVSCCLGEQEVMSEMVSQSIPLSRSKSSSMPGKLHSSPRVLLKAGLETEIHEQLVSRCL